MMGDLRNLKVWKDVKDIAIEIYKIIKSSKDYFLKDQLRRASVSISSNIAEGDERFNNKESIWFFYIANGSIAEVITQNPTPNKIKLADPLIYPISQRLQPAEKTLK